MSMPPRLHVQTQAGPSTPAPPRRPQGARRRGVAPGLYIANPDDSDGDGSPNHSTTTTSSRSPVRTGGSPGTASIASTGASSSLGRIPSGGSISIPYPSQTNQPSSPRSALPPIPSIPAPQSSPLPPPTPLPHSATPIAPPPLVPHHSQPSTTPHHAPMPPPQPERHLRRAQTTPVPVDPHGHAHGQGHRPGHEPRGSLGGNTPFQQPSSPSRALPPLPPMPSPPITSQSPLSTFSANGTVPASAPPTTNYPISVDPHAGSQPRMASPESALSPAGTIDSGKSYGSMEMGGRARSGSVQSSKVRVQVTTDNESFTTVDITGMQTAEGIKERVFSKVSLYILVILIAVALSRRRVLQLVALSDRRG